MVNKAPIHFTKIKANKQRRVEYTKQQEEFFQSYEQEPVTEFHAIAYHSCKILQFKKDNEVRQLKLNFKNHLGLSAAEEIHH